MTTIAQWDAFAEATLTGQDTARGMGRELAAQTPPVRLARRARHRKPNRRPRILLPLWAEVPLLAFQALHEMEDATAAQLGQYAQHGAL